ncbi:FkbM family methyltransferase [Methylobacterium sp. WL9]|uniref:FkbM family methyltransferase n=1 Tax=Methylobacterium sp. WL9 TaxID=2603898 RepID=UPI0011CB8863|nr:FkbM family methyltransferase [Methylobacterium sp. WL9]TXN20057.1 FkbM family methyltransferase [Methylobacterium sp. WL9]
MLNGTLVSFCGARLFVPEGHFCESILLDGLIPEYHVNAVFHKFVKTGDVVVDIGANVGFHTFALRQIVGDTGKVYAVEADIDNATAIRTSILKSGDTRVFLLPVAAGDTPGILTVATKERTNAAFSSQGESSNTLAVCVRLDDVIQDRVDFIKIDIEGAEISAVRGMTRILEARPVVASEFCPHHMQMLYGSDRAEEYLQFFFERSYICYYIMPSGDLEHLSNIEAALQKQRWARETLEVILIDLVFIPSERVAI